MSGASWIAGRLVALEPDGFRLRRGTEEVRVLLDPAQVPPIGALVRVQGRAGPADSFRAEVLEVVGLPNAPPGETPEWQAPEWPRKLEQLADRDRLLRALRGYFHGQGFLEVATPTLLRAPGQEPHLLPFRTAFHARDGAVPLWLATSPEYAMKRLLAVGCERIFELGRSYRDGRDEHSPLHAPEFTMIEWYRVHADLAAIGRDVEEVLRLAARELRGTTTIGRAGQECDVARPAEWLPVAEAFRRFADVELAPYLDGEDRHFLTRLPPRWRHVEQKRS